jgi:hypothetical protein
MGVLLLGMGLHQKVHRVHRMRKERGVGKAFAPGEKGLRAMAVAGGG